MARQRAPSATPAARRGLSWLYCPDGAVQGREGLFASDAISGQVGIRLESADGLFRERSPQAVHRPAGIAENAQPVLQGLYGLAVALADLAEARDSDRAQHRLARQFGAAGAVAVPPFSPPLMPRVTCFSAPAMA